MITPLATRYPLRRQLVPEDIARIWRRLNDEWQARTAVLAEADGVTREQFIRRRVDHVLGIITGPPMAPSE